MLYVFVCVRERSKQSISKKTNYVSDLSKLFKKGVAGKDGVLFSSGRRGGGAGCSFYKKN